MKPIKTLLFLLLFAIFVFCFLHGVLFNRPFKRFIYYYLWPPLSKISLPFQVQLSKIHMVHKIKNTQTFISTSTTLLVSDYMSTTLTQKHNFAEKMTTIYAIVLLSIRFLYRSVIGDQWSAITLELKTTFFKINPTLLCASSTKFLVFWWSPSFFKSLLSFTKVFTQMCCVSRIFQIIFFSRFVYLAFKKRSKSGSYRLKQRFDPTATFCTFKYNKYKKPLHIKNFIPFK